MGFWAVCLVVTQIFMFLPFIKSAPKIWQRKVYHFLCVGMFVPAVAKDMVFTGFCMAAALALMLLLEAYRVTYPHSSFFGSVTKVQSQKIDVHPLTQSEGGATHSN
eukprot:gene15834-4781_t